MAEAKHKTPIVPVQELIGQRFTMLVVVKFSSMRGYHRLFECLCDCGEVRVVQLNHLRSGASKSCGCASSKRIKRGSHRNKPSSDPKVYDAWRNLFPRCDNQKNKDFHRYGGRGIDICDRWRNGEDGKSGYDCFLEDMGKKPSERHSIDRINNDGNYEPSNCRWATVEVQRNNRRRAYSVCSISAKAREAGLRPKTVLGRKYNGWPEEKWFSPMKSPPITT